MVLGKLLKHSKIGVEVLWGAPESWGKGCWGTTPVMASMWMLAWQMLLREGSQGWGLLAVYRAGGSWHDIELTAAEQPWGCWSSPVLGSRLCAGRAGFQFTGCTGVSEDGWKERLDYCNGGVSAEQSLWGIGDWEQWNWSSKTKSSAWPWFACPPGALYPTVCLPYSSVLPHTVLWGF